MTTAEVESMLGQTRALVDAGVPLAEMYQEDILWLGERLLALDSAARGGALALQRAIHAMEAFDAHDASECTPDDCESAAAMHAMMAIGRALLPGRDDEGRRE